jgi:predicted DNA-binding transcriptional regulator AlpA
MEESQAERRTLTIPEVATALGLGRSTAFALAKRDALPVPVIRLGRRLVVSRELVERLLAGESARGLSSDDIEAA